MNIIVTSNLIPFYSFFPFQATEEKSQRTSPSSKRIWEAAILQGFSLWAAFKEEHRTKEFPEEEAPSHSCQKVLRQFKRKAEAETGTESPRRSQRVYSKRERTEHLLVVVTAVGLLLGYISLPHKMVDKIMFVCCSLSDSKDISLSGDCLCITLCLGMPWYHDRYTCMHILQGI